MEMGTCASRRTYNGRKAGMLSEVLLVTDGRNPKAMQSELMGVKSLRMLVVFMVSAWNGKTAWWLKEAWEV
ncbi:hypothetical protein QQ045_010935 [Rhodiola kirilowii]